MGSIIDLAASDWQATRQRGVWYHAGMEENPYKAPLFDSGAPSTERKDQRQWLSWLRSRYSFRFCSSQRARSRLPWRCGESISR
jgi:hypothetical protein